MKVKAFSILELTFALFITAILISFAYYTWSLLNSRMNRFSSELNEQSEISHLHMMLYSDIDAADRIQSSAEQLLISQNYKVVTYSFSDNVIVRNATVPDTIIDRNASVNLTDHDSGNQSIRIILDPSSDQPTTFSFYKEYDPEKIINH